MFYLRLFILLFSILMASNDIVVKGYQFYLIPELLLLISINLLFWKFTKFQGIFSNLLISLIFLSLTFPLHIMSSTIWVHGVYVTIFIFLSIQLKEKNLIIINTVMYSLVHLLVEWTVHYQHNVTHSLYDFIMFSLVSLMSFELVVEDYSNKDYLTGLLNFKGFQKKIEHIWSKDPRDFNIIFIDFINFKALNEKHGAQEGDDTLRLVASTLKRKLPGNVLISRYEGDCFVVGYSGHDEYTRKKLDHALEGISTRGLDSFPLRYTISCASYPKDADDLTQLIQIAEQRIEIEKKIIHEKEEERKKRVETLSAIGQLAAGLAHEIRNPLTSVRGLIQLSAEENPNFKKWEEIILPEIDRMNELLTDFLHLAQNREAKKQGWSVKAILHEVYVLLQPKALLLGHEIKIDELNCNIKVFVDKKQMQQVLINLIQNALEAFYLSGGLIKISCNVDQNQIDIIVEDNGKGIPPEKVHHIFEPFYTTKEEGTGLGLAICHRIVTDHHGTIKVNSRLSQGTSFNITLPIYNEGIKEN